MGTDSLSVSKGLLLITNVLSVVKIEKLIVPDVVQSGNSSEAILDCQYQAVDDKVTVKWLFNRSKTPFYQWSPYSEPQVGGILNGRLDLTFRKSKLANEERRALRIVKLSPELSGEYTCCVQRNGVEDRQTKTMIVFSPERDFDFEVENRDGVVYIKCIARGLFPQPDVVIEVENKPVSKQELRVWRDGTDDRMAYDSECIASLYMPPHPAIAVCRLSIPDAGYISIREKNISGSAESNNSFKSSSMYMCTLTVFLFVGS